ncbi:choice-of-anchor D domain-containing protein [Bacteroidota bacterium]
MKKKAIHLLLGALFLAPVFFTQQTSAFSADYPAKDKSIVGKIITPEMDIKGNSISIVNGDNTPSTADGTDFGNVDIGGNAVTHTFTIYNTGTTVLNLTGTPRIAISGAQASDFTVITSPNSSIPAAGSSTFTISFDPSSSGLKQGIISIANDDGDENPYTFYIQGTGTSAAEMDVSGNSISIADNDATPNTADGTDFGTTILTGGIVDHIFTIENSGSADLNLTGTPIVVIGGTHSTDFTVIVNAVSPVTSSGGTTTFTIRFNPTAVGARVATVSIANNDGDENPYNFSIQGTADTSPEMGVQGNGVPIPNNKSIPSVTDDTDFGNATIGVSTVDKVYTIENTGDGDLSLTSTPKVEILGTHASDFSVFADATTPVASGGGTTTFTIRFSPTGAGVRSAIISIPNDDADENPYHFNIQGTGDTTPEINLTGNNISIADGDATPSLTDNTDFGSADIASNVINKTFKIENLGSGALNLTGTPIVAISGTNAADFSVSVNPTTPVASGGGFTTFIIQFDPSAVGLRTATLTIANNDTDENPYNFNIQGTGTISPEMNVKGNAVSIVDNDVTPSAADDTDFEDAIVGLGTVVHVFTIENTGSTNLNLTSSPRVIISGTHASDFTVTADAATPVAAAGTTNFTVTFLPSAAGLRSATINIANDDINENPYNFSIQGTGVNEPEMDVFGNGNVIADEDATPATSDDTDFGNTVITTGTTDHVFTIQNNGNASLALSGTPMVVIGGTHAADFSVFVNPATPVASGGGTTTFTIKFSPSAAGLRSATLSIANNDTDENPYNFSIEGTGITAPEINVTGNSQSITDGDDTPSVTDYTDFGSTDIAAGTIDRIFIIQNIGTADLTLGGVPKVAISGAHAGDFSVTVDPTTPITAGNTTTFTLRFNPSATGSRTAIVSISNNDSDENPYNFFIQGTGGDAPEMEVIGNGNTIIDGDVTPDETDYTDFGSLDVTSGSLSHTFSIKNTGSASLTLTGAPLVEIGGLHSADFSVTTSPTSPVGIGGTTNFIVEFNPGVSGLRTATISIANNDTDENPYNFFIQGTGMEAEMDLTGNGVSIVDGDASPSFADETDFGNADILDGRVDVTYTIENTGNADLDLSGVPIIGISGTHAADFTVFQNAATPVASGGGTTTFTIRFEPTVLGLRTATISISNNDFDENPYNFNIQGTGVNAPEINVIGNLISISDGDATPDPTDFTDFGIVDIDGVTLSHTFSIENTGSAVLNLTGAPIVSVGGLHPGDFTVTTMATTPVAVDGGITTFIIEFNPTTTGLREATISIANNDTDENPYNFSIQGTGVTPEIDIQGNGISISNGDVIPSAVDNTEFSNTDVSTGYVDHTFTIQNTGSGELNLINTPLVVIAGANPSDFSVVSDPTTPVAANGGSTTFIVRFDPTAEGLRTASVSVANNDIDENPYSFSVHGTAISVPEIDITGNAISITDGDITPSATDDTDFGTVDITSTTVEHTFTIENSGSSILILTGTPMVNISGTNADDFTVTLVPTTNIAVSGGTTTFTVEFNPSDIGIRTAIVSIPNNDSNENPYNFYISGTGIAQEINVQGNHLTIVDGDPTPRVADYTDFGTAILGNTDPIDHTFAIQNIGAVNLNLTGTPKVAISGTNAADFSVYMMPATMITPGSTSTFIIRFLPSAVGVRTAVISIANDDADENPYDFAIQGTAILSPEIDVLGNDISIADGETAVTIFDNTDFGSANITGVFVNHSFTIENLGSDTLRLSGTPRVTVTGGGFSLLTDAAAKIDPVDGTTTFIVKFDPSVIGTHAATISIANNDLDENPYNFSIQGIGIAVPEINILGNSYSIVDGDATPSLADNTDFGTTDVIVGTVDKEFIITNSGSGNLLLTGDPIVAIGGTNAADFSVLVEPEDIISTISTSTFTIRFNPQTGGLRTAIISIANNDDNEDPYTFTIQGSSTSPEMNVKGNGVSITDGSVTTSATNDTDFGNIDVVSGEASHTFTIENTATVDLLLTGTPVVVIAGTNAGDFTITEQAVSPVVADGGTSTFTIHFDPHDVGVRTATVSIANNDDNENPYNFTIAGTSTSSIGINDEEYIGGFRLLQNYPNPFSEETRISFDLLKAGSVSVNIYNSAGKIVETLHEGNMDSGVHHLTLYGADKPSGTYIIHFRAGNYIKMKRCVLIK